MAAPSAKLTVAPEVTAAFNATTSGSSTSRSLHLKIDHETITLTKTTGSTSCDIASEFGSIHSQLDVPDQAAFVLFNMTGAENTAGDKWLLVTW